LKQIYRSLLTLFIPVLLAACASKTPDAPLKSPIRTISLVPASNPNKVFFENSSVVSGLNFMLAAAHRADTQNKQNILNSSVDISGSNLGDRFTEKVAANLRAAGYQVEILTNISRPIDYPDNIDIRAVPITTDAILQLSITYVGVTSGATSSTFHPHVTSYAVLYPKGHRNAHFDGEVQFGTGVPDGKDWGIKADSKLSYPSADAVLRSVPELRSFYLVGTEAMANRVSEQMVAKLR
jgi:hypothetical protein